MMTQLTCGDISRFHKLFSPETLRKDYYEDCLRLILYLFTLFANCLVRVYCFNRLH